MELKAVRPVEGSTDLEVYQNKAYCHDNCEHPDEIDVNLDCTQDPNENHKVTQVLQKSNVEVEEEDNEPDPNCFVRMVIKTQTAISDFWKNHGRQVKIALLVLVIAGYCAYFGYAMWYRFGDEGSIRLVWISCLVLFCICLHFIWKYFGENIKKFTAPITDFTDRRSLAINYTLLGLTFLSVAVFTFIDVFYTTKNPYNLVSLSGIVVYIVLFFVFSHNPSKVNWRTVGWGFALQFVMALITLRWTFGYEAFQWLGDRVTEYLAYVNAGSEFVFGETYAEHFVAFQVLPTVIFFSATISVLYYLGAMQYVIVKVAKVMQACMGTTACESINAAGNIFIGQTEAPLMIRPMLKNMTSSELHAVMTGGFATIAGSVLGAYILFGVPPNHLLAASVMSAPAALAVSKLAYPETEKTKTDAKVIGNIFESSGDSNLMEALSTGASNAISLVANIAANLITFIAALEFVNATLTYFGQRVGIEALTLQFICSYVLWPFAVVMGVDIADCRQVAGLIGTKTFLNEFIAYQELGVLIENQVVLDAHVARNGTWYYSGDDIVLSSNVTLENGVISTRSVIIATYALCGFSNIGSIGIQLGGFTAMAPERKADFARLVVRAMIAGSVACFTTACIAGLYFQPVKST